MNSGAVPTAHEARAVCFLFTLVSPEPRTVSSPGEGASQHMPSGDTAPTAKLGEGGMTVSKLRAQQLISDTENARRKETRLLPLHAEPLGILRKTPPWTAI